MKQKVLSALALFVLVVVGLALPAPASAAVSQVWHAMPGSTINSDGTLTLAGGSTSVEGNGNFGTVDDADVIKLTYTLSDGAQCIGGAPRVYAEIGGAYVNSWDQNIGDGVEAACAAKLVVPEAGAITAMGVVYDNGSAGTVTVTSLTIAGTAVDFKATTGQPDPLIVTPEKPDYTPPTCDTTGKVKVKTTEGITYANVLAKGKRTVTATANEGFALKAGAEAEWVFAVAKLTGPQCDPTDEPTTPGNGGGDPTDEPTDEPTATPSATPTGSTPSASSSTTVVPGAVGGGDSGDLPKTGVKVLGMAGAGGLLVAVGGLLFVWARRRRDSEPGSHREDGDTQVMPAI